MPDENPNEPYDLADDQPDPQPGGGAGQTPPPPHPGTGAGDATTPPTSPGSTGEGTTSVSDDEKMWALFCHLAPLIVLIGVPFLNIVGPLVIWLIKRDEMPLVDDQGKESLNFQITVTIATLIVMAVSGLFAVTMIFPPMACIAMPVAFLGALVTGVIFIAALVMVILAAIEAQKGRRYRYPYCWRIVP